MHASLQEGWVRDNQHGLHGWMKSRIRHPPSESKNFAHRDVGRLYVLLGYETNVLHQLQRYRYAERATFIRFHYDNVVGGSRLVQDSQLNKACVLVEHI